MLSFLLRSIWLFWSWLELVALTIVMYLLAWLPQSILKYFYHYWFRIWCSWFVRALGVNLRLHEKNVDPIPPQYILIANHPSALEDVGIPTLFDVYPLAKQGVRDWFLVGKINEAAGTIFVKRDNKESRHAASEKLQQILEQGKNIVIFPEGGCKGRRIYERFEYGAFDLSIRTGIPVLPVFLHYEAQETFEWRAPYTLLHKIWHFMTSQNDHANYYVYDPIYPSGFRDKHEFMEHAHKLYVQWQARYLE